MIARVLAFALVIGLAISLGTVFLSLIFPVRDQNGQLFGWPSPWIKIKTSPFEGGCAQTVGFSCSNLTYDFIPQNLLIDWGIFSFIFFLLLIILYKTNVLK